MDLRSAKRKNLLIDHTVCSFRGCRHLNVVPCRLTDMKMLLRDFNDNWLFFFSATSTFAKRKKRCKWPRFPLARVQFKTKANIKAPANKGFLLRSALITIVKIVEFSFQLWMALLLKWFCDWKCFWWKVERRLKNTANNQYVQALYSESACMLLRLTYIL